MLQGQTVNATDHHNHIQRHQQSSHRAAQPKSAVEKYQRNGQQREPNMRAHPALQCPEAPEHDSFAHTEEGGKNKNGKRDCAVSKAQWRAADAAMLRRCLYERWWQTKSGGQTPRMKIANVNPECCNGGEHDKNQPGNVRA